MFCKMILHYICVAAHYHVAMITLYPGTVRGNVCKIVAGFATLPAGSLIHSSRSIFSDKFMLGLQQAFEGFQRLQKPSKASRMLYYLYYRLGFFN